MEKKTTKKSCGCLIDDKGNIIKLCDTHEYIKEAKRIKEVERKIT